MEERCAHRFPFPLAHLSSVSPPLSPPSLSIPSRCRRRCRLLLLPALISPVRTDGSSCWGDTHGSGLVSVTNCLRNRVSSVAALLAALFFLFPLFLSIFLFLPLPSTRLAACLWPPQAPLCPGEAIGQTPAHRYLSLPFQRELMVSLCFFLFPFANLKISPVGIYRIYCGQRFVTVFFFLLRFSRFLLVCLLTCFLCLFESPFFSFFALSSFSSLFPLSFSSF